MILAILRACCARESICPVRGNRYARISCGLNSISIKRTLGNDLSNAVRLPATSAPPPSNGFRFADASQGIDEVLLFHETLGCWDVGSADCEVVAHQFSRSDITTTLYGSQGFRWHGGQSRGPPR